MQTIDLKHYSHTPKPKKPSSFFLNSQKDLLINHEEEDDDSEDEDNIEIGKLKGKSMSNRKLLAKA